MTFYAVARGPNFLITQKIIKLL